MANYSNSHSTETRPPQKKKKFFHKFTCCYTSVPIYGSKFRNLGGQKNSTTFWHLTNSKKLALFGPANNQLVTYSKIQTEVCRVPWGPPMDWFLIKSVNAEYPLSCCKCVQKRTFCVLCPTGAPKCVIPPQKWYHHIPRYLPTYKPQDTLMPHHSSIEKKLILLRHLFWQITRTALESPKIDICQNWPRRVLGDVIRCLEFKFDKKIPMGSVPNCQKEIPVRHAIRWFKCKLKPPKNEFFILKGRICKTPQKHREGGGLVESNSKMLFEN